MAYVRQIPRADYFGRIYSDRTHLLVFPLAMLILFVCPARGVASNFVRSVSLGIDARAGSTAWLEVGDEKPTSHSLLGGGISLTCPINETISTRFTYDIGASQFTFANPFTQGAIQGRSWGAGALLVRRMDTLGSRSVELGIGPIYREFTSRASQLASEIRGPTQQELGGVLTLGLIFYPCAVVRPTMSAEVGAFAARAHDPTTGSRYNWASGSLAVSLGVRFGGSISNERAGDP